MWKSRNKGRKAVLWLMFLTQINSFTSVESTNGDGNVDRIEVKDHEGEYVGITDPTNSSTIDVVYKKPKHLDSEIENINVNSNQRSGGKPPCHLADAEEPCVIVNARVAENTESDRKVSFTYPGDGGDKEPIDPRIVEDRPALISDSDTNFETVEEDAALILADGEDLPSDAYYNDVSPEEIVSRVQGRTIDDELLDGPIGVKEAETTLIFGSTEGTEEGTSGRVESAFYPAQINGNEDSDSTEIEEKIAAAKAADRDEQVGTRALKGNLINDVNASPRHKHKQMLRSSVARKVNVKRSSRGVEIRDIIVEKPLDRPNTEATNQNKRELFQMTNACRNKVENDGWVGDGWCDSSGGYNTAACGWDGGDCCKHTCVSLGVEGYDCTSDFDCKDPTPPAKAPFDYTACYRLVQTDAWVGDGYCDRTGGYNTAICNWDGGDCCPATCKKGPGGNCESKFFCEDPDATQSSVPPPPPPTKAPTKSPTKSPTKPPTPAPVPVPAQNGKPDYNTVSQACKNKVKNWQWVGDGWCDPDSQYNSPECAYDGGDCCKKTCTNGSYTCGSATGVGYRCEDPWVLGTPPTPAASPTPPANSSNNNNNNNNSGFNQNLSGEDKIWLDFHNERRKKYQEQYGYTYVPLMWSNTMKQSAKNYANYLAQGRCEDYEHDPNNSWGENLAVIWGNHNIERVMKAWVENEELSPNENYKSGHGHMTQALWRATKYLGCAWSQNSQCKLYVCRYIKPGNCNRGVQTWLQDTMADNSPCGPNCPPNEGCFHPHDSR